MGEGDGLPHLAARKKLAFLDLSRCPLTYVGLMKLPVLPELTNLRLRSVIVSPEALAPFQRLPNLSNLDVAYSGHRDKHARQLSKIRSLTHLQLPCNSSFVSQGFQRFLTTSPPALVPSAS